MTLSFVPKLIAMALLLVLTALAAADAG